MNNLVYSWSRDITALALKSKTENYFFPYLSINKNVLTSIQMVFSIIIYSAAS